MVETATRRPRRSAEEIHTAILEAARELFDGIGYEATTTRLIAKKAGISERLIYTHFGSKADLFDHAVIAPFAEVVTGYIDSWAADTRDWTADERLDYLVRGIYDLARQHRRALLTALAAHSAGETSAHENVLGRLAHSLQSLNSIPTTDEFYDLDLPATTITAVGMVLGTALLDDLIIPPGIRRPGRQRLIDEMRNTLLDGMRNRPRPENA